MASSRNHAPTRRYADCVKDVTRSSLLQPHLTPFVTSKLHSTKSGMTVMRASEFPCAVVVSVITSDTYTRTIDRTECNDINTAAASWLPVWRSNHTNHYSSKRREIIECNQPRKARLRELQTPARNFLDLIRARCSRIDLGCISRFIHTYARQRD